MTATSFIGLDDLNSVPSRHPGEKRVMLDDLGNGPDAIRAPSSHPPISSDSENGGGQRVPLLDELVQFLRRYVVMSEAQANAIALWIVHTHAFDAADASPYLAVTSPEKRSGKSRLFEVLEMLVAGPGG